MADTVALDLLDANLNDDSSAPSDQQEVGSDFGQNLIAGSFEAVVTSTDWTTQTVLSQLAKGNIELNPSFQRRDAWKTPRKSKYIESLILGIPVPQLVLAERPLRRNAFIVIDGKQRLLALRQFCATKDEKDFRPFSLQALDIRTDLDGVSYEDLQTLENHEQDLTNFENQSIRTVVIRNWRDERFLYQVFLRLNTGSVPLSPQELRQALHPGKFSAYVDMFSIESPEIKKILNLKTPDFRMRDAELVIRYFAFRNFLNRYSGNLAPLLDYTTKFFNDNWARDENLIRLQSGALKAGIDATISIFGEYAFRKWNGTNYEKALNRAVFDIMILFFDSSTVRSLAEQQKARVEQCFKELCEKDSEFRASIEGTTKSIEAIYTRLHKWAEKLRSLLGDEVRLPELRDGKISLG